MTTRNKLDKAFGPVGSTAGVILFVAGLIITCLTLTGVALVVTGAFFGFTSTNTQVDIDKRRVKFSNRLFGFFPIGKWIAIQPDMKIGIKKTNKVWRSYSQSNRILDLTSCYYRLFLYGPDGKEMMPIQKFDHMDSAKSYLEKYSKQLGLEVI